nr:uncharacterized protein LOC115848723 isoform X2 [Globicephala melas]
MSFTKCKTSFPTRRLSFRAVKRTNSIGFLQVSRDSSNLFNELSRKPFCFSGRFARVLEVKLQEVSSCSCRRSVFSFTMFPLAKNALSRLGEKRSKEIHLGDLSVEVMRCSRIACLFEAFRKQWQGRATRSGHLISMTNMVMLY